MGLSRRCAWQRRPSAAAQAPVGRPSRPPAGSLRAARKGSVTVTKAVETQCKDSVLPGWEWDGLPGTSFISIPEAAASRAAAACCWLLNAGRAAAAAKTNGARFQRCRNAMPASTQRKWRDNAIQKMRRERNVQLCTQSAKGALTSPTERRGALPGRKLRPLFALPLAVSQRQPDDLALRPHKMARVTSDCGSLRRLRHEIAAITSQNAECTEDNAPAAAGPPMPSANRSCAPPPETTCHSSNSVGPEQQHTSRGAFV